MTIFCGECGTGLAASPTSDASAASPRCQKCGREVAVAGGGTPGVSAAAPTTAAATPAPAPTSSCPYCLSGIRPGDEVGSCPGCQAVYHRECWQENGGCAVYGGFSDDVTFRSRTSPDVCGLATMIVVADTPLSFVGDTVTLPITLCAAAGRSIAASRNAAAERERQRPITKLPPQSEPGLQDDSPPN